MSEIISGFMDKQQIIRQLEAKLERLKNEDQRLLVLDELAGHYVFINVKKAQKLLAEEQALLRIYPIPDFLLNYHYNMAIVENQLYNYKLSDIHFKQAIELIEERGNVRQQVEVYINYAGTCINQNQMDQATMYLGKAQKLLELYPDDVLQARLICREGFLNLHISNYEKAIELLMEAEKMISTSEKNLDHQDYMFLTLIWSGLGNIFEKTEEMERSARAYLNAINMCESSGINTRIAWHYLNVGNAFLNLDDYDIAESYFRKAIKSSDDISQSARAYAYSNLGYCYFKKESYSDAIEWYNRADILYREKLSEDHENIARISSWKGRLYAAIGRRKRAERHFVEAMQYAQLAQNNKQLSSICKDIAAFYSDHGDYKNAYEYQMMHSSFAEKYIEQVNSHKIQELEVRFEVEKKKQETERLRWQAVSLQQKALRAQMNPHFMFNALNSIQDYITSSDITQAAKYLSKFAHLMRQSLDYSDLESISLEEEIEFLQDYLYINSKLRFSDSLNYEIYIDEEIEEDILGVPTMIVQPYLENAIEHGIRPNKGGLIKLSFYLLDDNTIECIVEDNGVGREKARETKEKNLSIQNHRSKGTSITEQRLEILNKNKKEGLMVETIDLYDAEGKPCGTRVKIQIPVVEIQLK